MNDRMVNDLFGDIPNISRIEQAAELKEAVKRNAIPLIGITLAVIGMVV